MRWSTAHTMRCRVSKEGDDVSEEYPTNDQGSDQAEGENPRDANAHTRVLASCTPATTPAEITEEPEVDPHSHLDWPSFMAVGIADSLAERLETERESESEGSSVAELPAGGSGTKGSQ